MKSTIEAQGNNNWPPTKERKSEDVKGTNVKLGTLLIELLMADEVSIKFILANPLNLLFD